MEDINFTFTYNCQNCCQHIGGAKRMTIQAKNKTEAIKIMKEFLEKNHGILVNKFF